MFRSLLLLSIGLTANCIFAQKNTERIDSLNFKAEELYANDVEKSIAVSTRALKLSKESDYQSGEAFAYMNLAVANDIKGNSAVATSYFHKAIRLFKLEKNEENLSYCYSQLGVCYFSQYQYENADFYYRKAIELCKKNGFEIDLADALVNQGITFTYQNKPKAAKKNFLEAIGIYNRKNYPEGLGAAYNSLAKIYYDEGDLHKAIAYFEKSAANFKTYRSDFNLISAYNGTANCYLDLKDYQKAEEYALKSLELSKATGAKEREVFVHETLSRIYSGLGEYQKAYESLNEYTVLSDTIFTQEKSDALAEMQARFEVKDLKLKQRAEEEQHWWQMVILLIIIFIVLLVSVLLFFLFRNKKRINVLLEQKYIMTQANLEQKEFMMGEVHHRVKNNLQIISAILDLQSRELKDPESIKLIDASMNRINAISMIHQKLYQSENIRAVQIGPYLAELVNDLVTHFKKEVNKEIFLNSECDNLSLDIETALPIGLIVAELVMNSCKYAFDKQENPQIGLSLKLRDKKLFLVVADNGNGKSNITEGTHFGAKLIRSMARKLQATINETSSERGLKTELVITKYNVLS
ncbi:histidine kinase dimerization/phosphoacceptor domain -containing protein [Fluviicola sp.]|uniref:histidine kinase dimerization/phosphoacceptor domain -containing protein n=1 Tax=Fluviicola sp. TaxID=1917219 RepID=UPI0031D3E90C